jgi:hypothetical protein
LPLIIRYLLVLNPMLAILKLVLLSLKRSFKTFSFIFIKENLNLIQILNLILDSSSLITILL